MAINFPNSPANGDTHTAAGTTYVYDATNNVWKRQGSSGGFDPASVSESLIPDANETYDLGSSTNKFRDLYLSGNSITLGTVELSDNGGALEVTPTGGGSAEPFATETYVTTQVNNLVDAAPGALDTLNELAAALGDDANFSTTITNSVAAKLPLAGGTMTGAIDMGSNDITTTGKIKFANVYSTEADLPSASTYHGMFAHVHSTGAGYFAHAGSWVKLASETYVGDQITAAGSYSDSSVDSHLNQSTATTDQMLVWDGSDYAWSTPAEKINILGGFADMDATNDQGQSQNINLQSAVGSFHINETDTFDNNGNVLYAAGTLIYFQAQAFAGSGIYYILATPWDTSSTWTHTGSPYFRPSTGGSYYGSASSDARPTTWRLSYDGVKAFVLDRQDTQNNSSGAIYIYQNSNINQLLHPSGNGSGYSLAWYQPFNTYTTNEFPLWDFRFSQDGTKIYLTFQSNTGNSDPNEIQRFDLTTAWDLSTASASAVQTLATPTTGYSSARFAISPDGKTGAFRKSNVDIIYYTTFSTAFDLTTAGSWSQWPASIHGGNGPADIFFKPDGTKLYIMSDKGSYAGKIFQYDIPVSALNGYATETYVTTQVNNLVDAAPGALDTLNELAAALGDDAAFSTTVTNSLATKADTSSLATVATSGSYNDLSNKPTIPTAIDQTANVLSGASPQIDLTKNYFKIDLSSDTTFSTTGSPTNGEWYEGKIEVKGNASQLTHNLVTNPSNQISNWRTTASTPTISGFYSQGYSVYGFFAVSPNGQYAINGSYVGTGDYRFQIIEFSTPGDITSGSLVHQSGNVHGTISWQRSNVYFATNTKFVTSSGHVITVPSGSITTSNPYGTLPSVDTAGQGNWSSDGTKYIGVKEAQNQQPIFKLYTASTPFYANTLTLTQSYTFNQWTIGGDNSLKIDHGNNVHISDDGLNLYTAGYYQSNNWSNQMLMHFTLSTAFDLSTMSHTGNNLTGSYATFGHGRFIEGGAQYWAPKSNGVYGFQNLNTPAVLNTTTWPGTWSWEGGVSHSAPPNNETDIVNFVSTDGGSTFNAWVEKDSDKSASFDGQYSSLTGTPTLATVATSGSYNDLTGTPTIPTNNNQLTNGAGYVTSAQLSGDNTVISYSSTSSASTNDVMMLNTDGTVTPVEVTTFNKNFNLANSGSAHPETADANDPVTVGTIPDNRNMVIHAYHKNGHLHLRTASYTGNTITYGSEIDTNQYVERVMIFVDEFDTSKFILFYTKDSFFYARSGEIVGTSIQLYDNSGVNNNLSAGQYGGGEDGLAGQGGAAQKAHQIIYGHGECSSGNMVLYLHYAFGNSYYVERLTWNSSNLGAGSTGTGIDSNMRSQNRIYIVDNETENLHRLMGISGALPSFDLDPRDPTKFVYSYIKGTSGSDYRTAIRAGTIDWTAKTSTRGNEYELFTRSSGSFHQDAFQAKVRIHPDNSKILTLFSVPAGVGGNLSSGETGALNGWFFERDSLDNLTVFCKGKIAGSSSQVLDDLEFPLRQEQVVISHGSTEPHLHLTTRTWNGVCEKKILKFSLPTSQNLTHNTWDGSTTGSSSQQNATNFAPIILSPNANALVGSANSGSFINNKQRAAVVDYHIPQSTSKPLLTFTQHTYVESNLDKSKIHGLAATSGTTPDVTTQFGVHSGLSGLTVGSKYYVLDDGTLSTTPDTHNAKIGVAVKSTHIALDFIDELTESDLTTYATKSYVATQTFSGNYNDLTNQPTIPTNNNQLTNGAGFITAADVPNANTIEYTSTSSASVDDVVMLNTDGTVTPVEVTTTNANGTLADLNPAGGAGSNFNKAFAGHFPSDPLKVLQVYRSSTTWRAQILEDTVSNYTWYQFSGSYGGGAGEQKSYPFVSPVDESKVLWISKDHMGTVGIQTFTGHIFDVTDVNNITVTSTTHDIVPGMQTLTDSNGSTWSATSNLSNDANIIYDYGNSSSGSYFFNIFFQASINAADPYVIRVEWDGQNAPTFSTPIRVGNQSGFDWDPLKFKLDSNNLGRLLAYDMLGRIRVYDIDYANGTSTLKASYQNTDIDSSYYDHAADWNPKVPNQIYSHYGSNQSYSGSKRARWQTYTFTGTSITTASSNWIWASVLPNEKYQVESLDFLPNSDSYVTVYRNQMTSSTVKESRLWDSTVAGNSIFSSAAVGIIQNASTSTPMDHSFDYTTNSAHGSVYYQSSSNSRLGFFKGKLTTSNLDTSKVHGIAATSGTTIDVTVENGIHTGLSGLTVGSKYYVLEDGSISLTPDTNNAKVGLAITSTSLALDFTDELTDASLATYATKSYVASQVPSLTGYATENYVDTEIANLVDSSPATLDTLNELAAALGDDANFSTTITNQIAAKADAYSIATVTASGGNFYVDGVQQVTLSFEPGRTYRFDQADSSNSSHPLRFSTTSDGTHGGGSEYTTGVTTNGTAGSAGAYVQIAITNATPTLYYYCVNHGGMGAGTVVGNFSGNYNDLTNLPTLFDGQFSSLTGTPSLYTDSAVDTHLNISGATTGQILSWNGTDYAWIDAAAGGGSSVSVSSTAPTSPSEGDLWFDEDDLVMYVWYTDGDSSQWIEANSVTAAAATIHASDTAPSGPSSGDLWFNTTLLDLYVYYADGDSNQWVQVGGAANSQTSGSGGGSSVQSLIETANTSVTTTDTGTDGHIDFTTNGTLRWEIDSNGHILPHSNASFDIGSAEKKVRYLFLDSNTMFVGDTSFSEDNIDRSMEVYTDQPAPSSNTDEGKKGDVRIVGNYMYVCINTNEWIRTQIEKDW